MKINKTMDNTDKLTTYGTQDEDKQNKGQSRIDNLETLATLGTQDTGRIVCLRPVSCVPNVASVSRSVYA
jgi:hypothetical protein